MFAASDVIQSTAAYDRRQTRENKYLVPCNNQKRRKNVDPPCYTALTEMNRCIARRQMLLWKQRVCLERGGQWSNDRGVHAKREVTPPPYAHRKQH